MKYPISIRAFNEQNTSIIFANHRDDTRKHKMSWLHYQTKDGDRFSLFTIHRAPTFCKFVIIPAQFSTIFDEIYVIRFEATSWKRDTSTNQIKSKL